MQTIAYGLEYTQFNYKDYSFQVVAPLVYLCHVIFRFLLDYYLLETAVPTMNFGVSAHSLPSPEQYLPPPYLCWQMEMLSMTKSKNSTVRF